MKKIVSVFVLCLLLSCNNIEVKEYHYADGSLRARESQKGGVKHGSLIEYYKSGEIMTVTNYENGKMLDSIKGYYKSGNLELIQFKKDGIDSIYTYYDTKSQRIESKGRLVNNEVKGWSIFYNNKGNIARRVEIINIGKPDLYVNRGFYYDRKGKIIDSMSASYEIKIDDTLTVNKKYPIKINYMASLPKESQVYFCYSYDIKDNFANIEEVKLDTLTLNNKNLNTSVTFVTPGKKNIRGFFYEKRYNYKANKANDTLVDVTINTNKMYFDIPVYVKE